MAATAEKAKSATGADELMLALMDGPVPLTELLGKVDEKLVMAAWTRGEVELGVTKYVVTGNPAAKETNHNGIAMARPSVVIEGGIEWSGPRQRWHGTLADVKRHTLPVARGYQKYQLEMCVNKEKDVWEWLPEGTSPGERETRYARRDIERPEAEKLFDHFVRLTDKGMTAVQS